MINTMKNMYHTKVMNAYEEKRKMLEEEMEYRKKEVYNKVPKMQEIELSSMRGSQLFMSAAMRGSSLNADFMKDFHEKQAKLKRIKMKTLLEAGFPEDYLDMKYDCKKCSDTGYVGINKCDCYEDQLREIFYKESNIGSIIREQQLEAFFFDDYSKEIKECETISNYDKAKNVEKFFIESINSSNPFHAYITGGGYEDRSQLGMFLTQKAIQSGKSAIYIPTSHMVKIYEDWRFNRKSVTPDVRALKESLPVVDYLILDSLGDEEVNSSTAPEIFELINSRIEMDKSTIVTTKLSMKECAQMYSERFVSRIIGFTEYIKIPSNKRCA